MHPRGVARDRCGALDDEEEEATLLRLAYDQFMFADVNVACHGSIRDAVAGRFDDEGETRDDAERQVRGANRRNGGRRKTV